MDAIDYIPVILISTLGFIIYDILLCANYPMPFKLEKLENKTERRKFFYEYVTNISSLIHAVVVTVYGIIIISVVGFQHNLVNINEENLLIAFSLGYFISDTFMGVVAGYNDTFMMLHHAFGIFGLGYVLIKQKYSNFVICVFAIAEISNPFIILRKNLDKHRRTEALSTIFGVIFCLSFLVCRTIVTAALLLPFFGSTASLTIKVFAGLLWYISLYWCYTIINLLTKALMDVSSSRALVGCYALLSRSRKNTAFIVCMHISFAFLCFFKTFYLWNHEEII